MDIKYRQLGPADESQFRELVDIVHAGLENEQFFFKYTDQEYDDMLTRHFVIGAFDAKDRLVGFNVMLLEKEYCEMDGIMLLSEYRGARGIAIKMYEKCIAHATKIGAKKIIAKIHPDNKNIIRSPEKAGFVPIKTERVQPYNTLRTIFELDLKTE